MSDHRADELLDLLADLVAEKVAARLAAPREPASENRWLTTAQAAERLGCHRDTVRKLAAERAIPYEQDGPGCKLYFKAADLDQWRAAGGRPAHRARVA